MGKAQQKRTTMILRPRKFISSFSTRYDKQRSESRHFPTTQSELSIWSGVNDFAPPDNKPFARIQRRKEKDKRPKLHGWLCAAIPLTNTKGNVRDQIQQDNAYLKNRHPRVVNHVKLVH